MKHDEALRKALQGAGTVAAELRETLTGATAIEALSLLPLIERTVTLQIDIAQFLDAIQADRKEIDR